MNKNIQFMKQSMWTAIYFVLLLTLASGLITNKGSLMDFGRELSLASKNNIDIAQVLGQYYLVYFLIIPCVFLTIVFFLAKICELKKNYVDDEFMKVVSDMSFVAVMMLLAEGIRVFGAEQSLHGIYSLITCILIFPYIYIALRKKEQIKISDMVCQLILCIQILFCLQIVQYRIGIDVPIYILFNIACIGIVIVFNFVKDDERLINALTPFSFLIFLSCITLEGIVILNQHEIYVSKPILVLFGLILVVSVLSVALWKKANIGKYEDYFCLGLVLSTVLLAGMPQVQSVVSTDLFEQANTSVSISQLVLFDKIPIVESISAHLGSDWLSNLLYYVLNGDYFGSLVAPYQYTFTLLWIIALYYVLKECLGSYSAMIICLCVPFLSTVMMGSVTVSWASIGFVTVYAGVVLVKKQSFKRYILFWSILALSLLYKADVGISLGIGAVMAFIVLYLIKKERIEWKQAIGSFMLIIAIYISIFSGVCVLKGVAPVERLKEFLAIFGASNQGWAYGTIGNAGNVQFFAIYFLVPCAVIFLLLYLFCLIKEKKLEVNNSFAVVMLTLGFAYFANFQRIIVRHNMYETKFHVALLYTAILFIPLAINVLVGRRTIKVFVSVFVSMILLFFINSESTSTYSIIQIAYDKFASGKMISEYDLDSKVQRVTYADAMQQLYSEALDEIDVLLEEGETFFDFSNQSLLYSLLKKENPAYVVQSPSLATSEYAQQCLIEQVKQSNSPIAISVNDPMLNCGIEIDSLKQSYRSYRISEYLNMEYIPVETVGKYVIWVKRDRTDLIERIRNTYESCSISESVSINDIILQKQNKDVILYADGKDPYVEGIFVPQLEGNGDFVTISVVYECDVQGVLNLYYKINDTDSYSEDKVLSYNIGHQGVATFMIESNAVSDFRLDIPVDSEFVIKDIYCSLGQRALNGYYYGETNSLNEHSLGSIPYLWGNQDSYGSYENTELSRCNQLSENVYELDNSYSNRSAYICLEIESNKDGLAVIDVGSNGEAGFDSKIKFDFNLHEGQNKYMIRVSADSFWSEGLFDALCANVPEDAKIINVNILEGD